MGGPYLWLYLVDTRAWYLSHRSPGLAPDPTPHHSWPFAVLPEKGTSLSEVSPSPAQGTWPTYWPEGGSRKISPFGNHEDPDLRTPSLAALRSGRLGLGSYLAGGAGGSAWAYLVLTWNRPQGPSHGDPGLRLPAAATVPWHVILGKSR